MNRLIATELATFFVVCVACLLLCCKPSAPTSAIQDITVVDASTVQGACAHMASLGCGGDAGVCTAGLTNLIGIGANVDLACIAAAPTKTAVQQCAGVGNGCP
jgi:hypothetical protein